MNISKWRDPSVPLTILALKLTEETGEVANAITDAYMRGGESGLTSKQEAALRDELGHVLFIAGEIKARLDRGEYR